MYRIDISHISPRWPYYHAVEEQAAILLRYFGHESNIQVVDSVEIQSTPILLADRPPSSTTTASSKQPHRYTVSVDGIVGVMESGGATPNARKPRPPTLNKTARQYAKIAFHLFFSQLFTWVSYLIRKLTSFLESM